MRFVNELNQAIVRWQDFANPVIALRQEGRAQEAEAAVQTGTGAGLINDFWQHELSLHDYVAATREADHNRIDQALAAQAIASIVLGALGILAAIAAALLARRIARLYRDVRVERSRVAELARAERRRANELDEIIEDMAEGLMVADQDGQIVHLNRVARQIWQFPSPEGLPGNTSELGRLDLRFRAS